jgi:hypothetical protein
MTVRGAVQGQSNTIRLASGQEDEACWWTASVNAREFIRRTDNGAAVTTALPPSVINSQGFQTSKMWARVGWFKEGVGNVAVFDVGAGMRISVNACSVEMDLVTPPDTFSVRDKQTLDRSFTGTGTFLDTTLRSSVVPGYAPIQQGALLTQTVLVGANLAEEVPMPPGTIAAEIYVPGAVVAGLAGPGFWVEFIDPTAPSSGGNVGTIPFLTIAAERTGFVPRPGNAAGIRLTNTTAGALFYTVVWKLVF